MWVAAPLLVIVVMALMGVMEWGGGMVSGIIGTGSVLLLILAIYIMQEPYKRFWPKFRHRYRGMVNGQEKDNSDHN